MLDAERKVHKKHLVRDVQNAYRAAMKRARLAKPYRISVTDFRIAVTKLLYRVDEGEAFVISRRAASADGWQEEDVGMLIPLNTSAEDLEKLREQFEADNEAARAKQAAYDASPRLRSDVRVIEEPAGDVKRGRRQHG
jgi:hypothetical protein